MIENVWHNTVILCLVFQSINLKKSKGLEVTFFWRHSWAMNRKRCFTPVWWFIFIVNLTSSTITLKIHLLICLYEIAWIIIIEVLRPTLNVGITIQYAGVMDWYKKKKKTNLRSIILPPFSLCFLIVGKSAQQPLIPPVFSLLKLWTFHYSINKANKFSFIMFLWSRVLSQQQGK